MRKVDSFSDAVDQSSDSNSDGDEGSEGDGESLLEVSPLLLLLLDFSVVGLLLSVGFEFSVLMLGERSVSWGCHLCEQEGVRERTVNKVKSELWGVSAKSDARFLFLRCKSWVVKACKDEVERVQMGEMRTAEMRNRDGK